MLDEGISRRAAMISAARIGGAAVLLAAANATAASVVNGSGTALRPFKINIPQVSLDDLKIRLSLTRWPDKETVGDLRQGVPLARMKALVAQGLGLNRTRGCMPWSGKSKD